MPPLTRRDGQPICLGPNILFSELTHPSRQSYSEISVLVVGSGGGAYTCRFYLEGFKRVAGIDLDPASVGYSSNVSASLSDPKILECLNNPYPYLPAYLNFDAVHQSPIPSNLSHLVADAKHLPFSDNSFDYTVIPWLLGVENGLSSRDDQLKVIEQALKVTNGLVKITPIIDLDKESAFILGEFRGIGGLLDDITDRYSGIGYSVKKQGLGLIIDNNH